MKSLMEIKDDNWTVIFYEENEGEEQDEELNGNDIVIMINDVCSS